MSERVTALNREMPRRIFPLTLVTAVTPYPPFLNGNVLTLGLYAFGFTSQHQHLKSLFVFLEKSIVKKVFLLSKVTVTDPNHALAAFGVCCSLLYINANKITGQVTVIFTRRENSVPFQILYSSLCSFLLAHPSFLYSSPYLLHIRCSGGGEIIGLYFSVLLTLIKGLSLASCR